MLKSDNWYEITGMYTDDKLIIDGSQDGEPVLIVQEYISESEGCNQAYIVLTEEGVQHLIDALIAVQQRNSSGE